MENSALDGANFSERFKLFDRFFKEAYDNNVQVIAFYSYGDALAHHATLLYCSDQKTYKVEIIGNGDQPKLFLRCKKAHWSVKTGEPVFKVKDVSVKEVYLHAVLCCKEFGTYNALTNSCQDWNNKFLTIFKKKRRTIWSWVAAGIIGAITGVGMFFLALPAIMYSS